MTGFALKAGFTLVFLGLLVGVVTCAGISALGWTGVPVVIAWNLMLGAFVVGFGLLISVVLLVIGGSL